MNGRRCFVRLITIGLLLALSRPLPAEEATPPSSITVLPGYHVELLRSASREDGSWISMTFEPEGSIIVGRDDAGFARLRPPADGSSLWTCERLNDALKHCRGVLCAYNSLFVNATDSMEFWRFRDLDNDGSYEDSKLLKSFDYRSRFGHGQNQIVLGPDGLLYLIIGNDVSFPDGFNERSPYLDPQKDRLLPDPHDAGEDDRVGYILRTDVDGNDWVIIAGGLRNQFDAAFNADGELFTWDADMEWDVGLPWYRPTRLNHVVSGGEYGWRWGTAKWPPYYADSLPANLETGLGSPTGMIFGYASQFPSKMRDRLFLADWQHGKILSATVIPDGGTYRAETEVFAEGGPLNVCDLLFGPDGALYFITGGRGSQSGLYRITYEGPEQPAAIPEVDTLIALGAAFEARELRKQMEVYHLPFPPEVISDIWPHLGHPDRWVRNAARVAIEHQKPEWWTDRIAEEADPLRQSTALLAWARVATPEERAAVQSTLLSAPLLLENPESLAVQLRAWSVLFSRGFAPSKLTAQHLSNRFAPAYPHLSPTINRDLCELLVFLEWPKIVSTTLPLIESAPSQEDEVHYVHALLRYAGPWTIEERTAMLRWFQHAATFTGGHLLPQVMANMRQDFLDSFSEAERTALATVITEVQSPPAAEQQPSARPLVQRWTLADLQPQITASAGEHDPQAGRKVMVAAGCLKCHRWEQSGAAIGPELTSVGKRYSLQMIAESIIDPSRVVDPKYSSTQWLLKSGQVVIGRAAGVQADEITVETNGLTQEQVKIKRDDIEESKPSTVSPMPTGLLDSFTADEVRELLLFLRGPVATGELGGEK